MFFILLLLNQKEIRNFVLKKPVNLIFQQSLISDIKETIFHNIL